MDRGFFAEKPWPDPERTSYLRNLRRKRSSGRELPASRSYAESVRRCRSSAVRAQVLSRSTARDLQRNQPRRGHTRSACVARPCNSRVDNKNFLTRSIGIDNLGLGCLWLRQKFFPALWQCLFCLSFSPARCTDTPLPSESTLFPTNCCVWKRALSIPHWSACCAADGCRRSGASPKPTARCVSTS